MLLLFIQVQAIAEKKRKKFSHKLRFSNVYNVFKVFAMWRKGLRRARPILTAFAAVGNQGNPLFFGKKRMACVSVASPGKLELFSIYLHLSRVA